MEPINELISHIESGTMHTCDVFAADVVLQATVPGWKFSVRGSSPVRYQLAEWFATPGRFEELRRTPVATGEVVEFLRTWDEPTGPVAAHQVHILEVRDDKIVSARVWCGGKWSASQLAEMAAAEARAHASV
jgi:hypothetical protein